MLGHSLAGENSGFDVRAIRMASYLVTQLASGVWSTRQAIGGFFARYVRDGSLH